MNKDFSEKEIFELLSQIPDPEIPVISIAELGMLQKVEKKDTGIEVTITPTYTGCPAMKQIENDIVSLLKDKGLGNVVVKLTYSPAWTTDWISDVAKEKLKKYGIAPPEKSSANKSDLLGNTKSVPCPLCNSENTALVSLFGSTACKSLYKCIDCKEPFDYFKCF